MNIFKEVGQLAKELIEMNKEFELFKVQVDRVAERESELRERVSRLEERLEGVGRESRAAAHAGIHELQARIEHRLTRIEVTQEQHRRRLGE